MVYPFQQTSQKMCLSFLDKVLLMKSAPFSAIDLPGELFGEVLAGFEVEGSCRWGLRLVVGGPVKKHKFYFIELSAFLSLSLARARGSN